MQHFSIACVLGVCVILVLHLLCICRILLLHMFCVFVHHFLVCSIFSLQHFVVACVLCVFGYALFMYLQRLALLATILFLQMTRHNSRSKRWSFPAWTTATRSWLDSQLLQLNCCSISRALQCASISIYPNLPMWPPSTMTSNGLWLQPTSNQRRWYWSSRPSTEQDPSNSKDWSDHKPQRKHFAKLHQLASWYRHLRVRHLGHLVWAPCLDKPTILCKDPLRLSCPEPVPSLISTGSYVVMLWENYPVLPAPL